MREIQEFFYSVLNIKRMRQENNPEQTQRLLYVKVK